MNGASSVSKIRAPQFFDQDEPKGSGDVEVVVNRRESCQISNGPVLGACDRMAYFHHEYYYGKLARSSYPTKASLRSFFPRIPHPLHHRPNYEHLCIYSLLRQLTFNDI